MEVDGEAIVAGGDTAKVLQSIEHPLDGVSAFVEVRRKAVLPDARDLRRDIGRRTLRFDFLAHGVGVVSFVAMYQLGRADFIEQGISGDAVGHLSIGEKKSDRTAIPVGQGMDFSRASAA